MFLVVRFARLLYGSKWLRDGDGHAIFIDPRGWFAWVTPALMHVERFFRIEKAVALTALGLVVGRRFPKFPAFRERCQWFCLCSRLEYVLHSLDVFRRLSPQPRWLDPWLSRQRTVWLHRLR